MPRRSLLLPSDPRDEWAKVETFFVFLITSLFFLAVIAALLSIFVLKLPEYAVVLIVAVFVLLVAVLAIGFGVVGERRRTLRRLRRRRMMHTQIFTIAQHVSPNALLIAPSLDPLHIPRPSLLRPCPQSSLPPYEQLFVHPGPPPCYSSLGGCLQRDRTTASIRSTLSSPPEYTEQIAETVYQAEETAVEIEEEIVMEATAEGEATHSLIVRVIDCSKEVPEAFSLPQNETVC